MFFIDELKDLKLYKRQFLLPVNEKSKKKNKRNRHYKIKKKQTQKK